MKLPLIKLGFSLITLFGLHLSAYATPDLANGKKIINRNAMPAMPRNLALVMAI